MSFKFVRQKDSMQCGVAALSMVCRHFGIEYSLRFLDSLCHATTAVSYTHLTLPTI